jgi:hypothetical protein
MFDGINKPCVNIEVVFAFNRSDVISTGLQEKSDRSSRDTLSKAGYYSTGNENIFCRVHDLR